jgi:hypothetical protein
MAFDMHRLISSISTQQISSTDDDKIKLSLAEQTSNGIMAIVESDDNDRLSNNAQEKQFEAEINNLDDISPFQVDMSVSAGVAEMVQKTSVVHKQLHFLSKIP